MKIFRLFFRVVLVAALLLGALFLSFRVMESPPSEGFSTEFVLERGWGVSRTAAALEENGLVRNRWVFLLRYRMSFQGYTLQAGRYLLSDSMTAGEIIGIFSTGDVVQVPTTWVTLVPGYRMEQSLEVLSCSLGFSMDELNSLSREVEFLNAMGIPCLEGYLYPETYQFADTLEAWEVINRIVAQGQTVMTPGWEAGCEGVGLTPFQGVILASIVEREAASDRERDLIAGVFINRLRTGMRLESCATVQYALGEVHERLLYSDLEIESPYNTYRNPGLPPGPICSPGSASLEAVVSPDTTEGYLFFVSREDGSGTHLFATTAAGHRRNINSVR